MNVFKIASKKVVALSSGGMDSSVLLAYLKSHGCEIQPVSFYYGGKHNVAEYNSLQDVCSFLELPTPIRINLDFVNDLFKSDLLSSGDAVPHGHYAQENMVRTVVPARNAIMLSIAAGLAESIGAEAVAIANHAGDHAIYPDCRPDFIEKMSAALYSGSGDKVSITAPFSHITKAEIAKLGAFLNFPLEITWSCYEGDREAGQCGQCGTCVERHWAHLAAGIEDKTHYRSDPKQYFKPEELKDLGL